MLSRKEIFFSIKKLKLLSSLSALLLVLSVGACDKNVTEDSSSDEVTSSESGSSTSSSETTPAPVELSNYTISITLKDEEGNTVAIPFYDSVYIQGSWDSWAEWVPLTNIGTDNEPILTTTFATIKEGTYEFKGLIGNQDDKVGWDTLTELIVAEDGKSNATFTVNAEDGDNYTNNLEFTVDATKVPVLEETPMDDETIAGLILAQVKEIYEEPWEAIHGYSKEEGEMSVEVWYTSDENDGTYGKAIWYDDEDGDETRYIVDGTQYIIDGDGEYDTANYANEYEDEFDTYAVATDTLGSAAASDATIAHEEGSSIYTLTVVDDDTTDVAVAQRAGDAFTILSVLESEEDEEYFAEKITTREVETLMAEFDEFYWTDYDQNPADTILSEIASGQNFTLTIEYYEYFTDYYTSSQAASSAWSNGNYDNQDLYVEITFTEDAVLMEYYTSYYGYLFGSLYDVELYVNTQIYVDEDDNVVDEQEGATLTDATAVYWLAEDEDTGDVALALVGYYDGHWQDNSIGYYALALTNYSSFFTPGEITNTRYGHEMEYDVTKTDYSFMMTLLYGFFYAGNYFGGSYSYGFSSVYSLLYNIAYGYTSYWNYFDVSATYYYDYEQLDIEIDTTAVNWSDSSGNHWVDQDFMVASVWNVGTSAITEEYASYLA